jgi:predicted enzyme related to lactoylglutathione lyase
MTISPKPNLQLIYVSNIEHSKAFYEKLFKTKAQFTSSRYVAFSVGNDALFALWTGGTPPDVAVPRYSEIGIMLPNNDAVDALFEVWRKNPEIQFLKEPYTEVFGRTFLALDPDGHMIRVCPLDSE